MLEHTRVGGGLPLPPGDMDQKLAGLGFERSEGTSVTSEAIPVEVGRWRVQTRRPAMGTLVSVCSIVDSSDRADHAVGQAFEEMDRLVAIFSLYDRGSALTGLNDTGRLDGAPPELTRVARAALEYHNLSDGAFEMTVGPVLELFTDRSDTGSVRRPTRAEVREAMERVGSRHVRVSRRRIRFERGGMAATLDGIAKGDIVDAIARTLERHGVRRYLVDAGGDIRVRGTREGGLPWSVAVRDPAGPGVLRGTIRLTSGAVATSGGYERYFDHDKTLHHIIDARAGRSPVQATSVSVVAPTAMAADALATTVIVLGPARGVALVDRIHGASCLVIDRQGRRWTSRAWQSVFQQVGEHRP